MATALMWSFYPLGISLFLGDLSNLKVFNVHYPIENIDSIPTYLSLVYVFEALVSFYNGLFLAISNGYIIMMTFALDSQIRIINTCLKEINTNIKRKLAEEYEPERCNNYSKHSELLLKCRTNKQTTPILCPDYMLKTFITDHKRILQTIEEIEAIYNPLNLFQMIISLVTVSVLSVLFTVQISSNSGSADITNLNISKMLLYTVCGIAELYLFCWFGDTITSQAENLCDGFYGSGWPEAYKNIKNSVRISMTRCRKPVHITAGKFYSLDLFMFTSIMKASYSYFSVLYGFISAINQKV